MVLPSPLLTPRPVEGAIRGLSNNRRRPLPPAVSAVCDAADSDPQGPSWPSPSRGPTADCPSSGLPLPTTASRYLHHDGRIHDVSWRVLSPEAELPDARLSYFCHRRRALLEQPRKATRTAPAAAGGEVSKPRHAVTIVRQYCGIPKPMACRKHWRGVPAVIGRPRTRATGTAGEPRAAGEPPRAPGRPEVPGGRRLSGRRLTCGRSAVTTRFRGSTKRRGLLIRRTRKVVPGLVSRSAALVPSVTFPKRTRSSERMHR